MSKIIDRIFFDHPASVDESYGEHFVFASRVGLTLIWAGGAALVHAVVPCLCERTASTVVKRLYAVITNRRAQGAATPVSPQITDDPLAYI